MGEKGRQIVYWFVEFVAKSKVGEGEGKGVNWRVEIISKRDVGQGWR